MCNMTVKNLEKLSRIANWYQNEAERCFESGNVIGCLFWCYMTDMTALEMEIS